MKKKIIRIGTSGAFSTGKSTLCKAISERNNLSLVKEVARSVAKDFGLTRIQDLRDRIELRAYFQWGCLLQQLSREANQKGSYISDRTPVDNAMYWEIYNRGYFPEIINQNYLEMCKRHMETYDFVILVTPEFSIVDDGFRATNEKLQSEENLIVLDFLHRWLPSDKILRVRGSVGERVLQVEEKIREVLS